MASSTGKRIALTLLALVLILFLLLTGLALALPYLLPHMFSYWLEQQDVSATINEVTIDWLQPGVTLGGVVIENQQEQGLKLNSLVLELELYSLLNKNIVVKTFQIDQLHVDTSQTGSRLDSIAGLPIQFLMPAAADETSKNETNNQPDTGSTWSVAISEIKLNDLQHCHYVNEPEHKLCTALQQLQWQGAINYPFPADEDEHTGSLTLQALTIEADQAQDFLLDRLQIELQLNQLADQQLEINNIAIDTLRFSSAQKNQTLSRIAGVPLDIAAPTLPSSTPAAEPTTNTKAETGSAVWQIRLLQLTLNDIQLCHQLETETLQYCTDWQHLNWQGPVQLLPIEDNVTIAEGDLLWQGQTASSSLYTQPYLRNEELRIQQLRAQLPLQVNIANISNTAFSLSLPANDNSGKDQAITNTGLDLLQISDLSLNESKLNIKKVELAELAANVTINAEGQPAVLSELKKLLPFMSDTPAEEVTTESTAEQAQTNDDKQGLTVSIEQFILRDSEALQLRDLSKQNTFTLDLAINKLQLDNLATTGDPTTLIDLDARLNQHGDIKLAGSFKSPGDPQDVDIKGSLRGLDLKPFSSFAEQAVGERINSGQLNLDIELLAKNSTLDSHIDVETKQLDFTVTNAEAAEQAGKKLGVPVNMALLLLTDNNNRIKLKLPIKGDLNNPSFNLFNVIRIAATKTISTAVINYYTPFGLVHAGKGLYDFATGLRFEPVLFNEGSSELAEEQQQFLNNLAKLIEQKPQLDLVVCGFAGANDLREILELDADQAIDTSSLNTEQRNQLLQLATQRAGAVKQYLVAQKAPADRLVTCQPSIKATQPGQVTLSL